MNRRRSSSARSASLLIFAPEPKWARVIAYRLMGRVDAGSGSGGSRVLCHDRAQRVALAWLVLQGYVVQRYAITERGQTWAMAHRVRRRDRVVAKVTASNGGGTK